MQRQLKQVKLEPLANKQPNLQKTDGFNLRESKKWKFRLPNQNDRYHKTEPTVHNIIEEMPRRLSKIRSQFSEEYMSLVNKLKVNLSRDCFERKEAIQIVKKREMFYNDENYGRVANKGKKRREVSRRSFEEFTRGKVDETVKRSVTTVQRNSERQTQTNREGLATTQTDSNDYRTILNSEKTQKIEPLLTAKLRGRYGNQHLEQIEQTNQNIPIVKRGMSKISRKISTIKEDRLKTAKPNEVYTHMEVDREEQAEMQQINESYTKLEEMGFHIQILLDIFESINNQTQKQERDGDEILMRVFKEYVLGNRKVLSNRILSDDISHIDQVYLKQNRRRCLRGLVLSERILIIMCIDLLSSSKFAKYLSEINQILVTLIGIYVYVFYVFKRVKGQLSAECEKQLNLFQRRIHQNGIHIKKELSSAHLFIQKKLFSVLKSNYTLLEQMKTIAADCESRNVTINRAFYQILRLYAIYLNNHQVIIERHPLLRTFATCPSPYLTKPATKAYTLVLDLDQTLVFAESSQQKLQVFIRPFAKEFLSTMSEHYEIIIFTSSMPQYSDSIVAQLPFISHRLFRFHCTRVKTRLIKDLLRIGRPLERTIIVDNEEQNFILQKGSGIRIREWRGQDEGDQQLNILGLFLKQLADRNVQDVREQLCRFSEFRSKYQ